MKRFALAACLMTTPAMADCDSISADKTVTYNQSYGITSHVTASVPQHTLCVSFSPASKEVLSVRPSVEQPYCFDVMGSPAQLVAPIAFLDNDNGLAIEPIDFDAAKLVFLGMAKECEAKLGTPASFKSQPKFDMLRLL
jgi:hypothetical protein